MTRQQAATWWLNIRAGQGAGHRDALERMDFSEDKWADPACLRAFVEVSILRHLSDYFGLTDDNVRAAAQP